MGTTSFTALALFTSALYAFQNLLRYLVARDWNGVLGILVAVLSGWGVVALAAHSDVTSTLHLVEGDTTLGTVNGFTQLLLGIAVGSAGTVLADFRKSFDRSDSSTKPPLVPPRAS